MASTIKLNYDPKALASVVNYDHKRDVTIWSEPNDCNLRLLNFIVQATGAVFKTLHFLCNIQVGPTS